MMDRDTLIKDYAAIIDRAREESEEIEQILGKALGYPWFKDDPKNFPTATEADGVCVGIETAWSLAMIAADRIKELEEYEKNKVTRRKLRKLSDSPSNYDELISNQFDTSFYDRVIRSMGVTTQMGRRPTDEEIHESNTEATLQDTTEV